MNKRVVFMPDVHLKGDGRACVSYRVAKMFLKDIKPDIVILGGDFLEVESLSAWDQNKRMLMEGRRYKLEIARGNAELDDLQENVCPDSELIFMQGNHEKRVELYVEKHPEVEGMVDVRENLKLRERGIEWVEENELLQIGKLAFLHGWYWNKHHAMRHVVDVGMSCMYGHVHKPQAFCHERRAEGVTDMAMSVGCLCNLNPIWMRNKPNSWKHGFGYVEFRGNGTFQATNVNITKGTIVFGGSTWRAR